MTLPACLTFAPTDSTPLDAAALAELQTLAAVSMGWQPLGRGAYLHHGDVDETENVIHVVGIPDASLAGVNVLLLV